MRMISILLTALSGLILFSCNSGAPVQTTESKSEIPAFDKARAKAFIDSSNQKFSEEIKRGDSIALASHYWPDAELLLDYAEPISGAGILSTWGGLSKMGVREMNFTTTDITGDQEFLIETGKYEMKDEKQNLIDRGKYVVVWQQRNGEWKLYRDIGNTSLPQAK